MAFFAHTGDDNINVDGFVMSLAFFMTQEAAYALPTAATKQHYDDSTSIRIAFNATDQVLYSSGAWATGDGYIAAKAAYQAAYADSIDYPDLATAKLTKNSLVDVYARTYYDGDVVLGANTFASDGGMVSLIHQYYNRFLAAGATPGGFYLRDIAGAEILLSLANLKTLADKIDDLHYDTMENIHDHYDAIDLLATIVAVKAYDITTGWPTIPSP